MKLGRFKQSPDEIKKYSLDYTQWLESGESISIQAFKIWPVTLPPLVVGTSTVTGAGKQLMFLVSGGTDQTWYRVAIEVTTSIGQIKEDFIDVSVIDPLVPS